MIKELITRISSFRVPIGVSVAKDHNSRYLIFYLYDLMLAIGLCKENLTKIGVRRIIHPQFQLRNLSLECKLGWITFEDAKKGK